MPTDKDLIENLGDTYVIWQGLKDYLNSHLKNPGEEWNFPGKKYGWSFRMKSGKRNIIYFLPKKGYFKVALVFGQKATDQVMASTVSDSIKEELTNATSYVEGRGIRIKVTSENILDDIRKLVSIKVES